MKLRNFKLFVVTLIVMACLISVFEIPAYAAAGSNMDTAERITPDTTVKGTYPGKTSIFYKVVLSKSGKLSVKYSGTGGSLDVAVLKPDGTRVCMETAYYDSNHDKYSCSFGIYVDAGTYYIRLNSGWNQAKYALNVSFSGVNETWPESLTKRNDYIQQAKSINLNQNVIGVMAYADSSEQDFYKFTVNTKTDLTLVSRTYSDAKGDYFILDSDGNKIKNWVDRYDNNVGYSRCKGESLTLQKGTYYLKVQRYYNSYKYNVVLKADIKVSSVSLNKATLTLDMAGTKTATLKATVSPASAANKTLKWSSSDTKVAKVSSDGKVTAVGAGTANIYAKATDGSGKKSVCKVTVKAAPGVKYATYVQSSGWQSWKKNGTMAGTSGESKRLEGMKISLTDKRYSGGIRYKTYIKSYGWLGNSSDSSTWAKDGQVSGATGKGKSIEVVKIQLYGEMANNYDIYYRANVQGYGWLAWTKNGASSGAVGKRLEAIQMVLVKKGDSAPANTYKGITSAKGVSYIK